MIHKKISTRQFSLIIFSAIILSLVACEQNFQTNNQIEIPENWKNLKETNYSINYPDSFDLDKSGQMGMSFVLLSKQTSAQDFFRENINLVIQSTAGYNISLDQYVQISLDQISTFISNENIIESERIKENNSKEFHRLVYTGEQGQYNLKWLQYYWIVDENAYVLTLTCEIDQYENYLLIGMKIMNTFRIL